MRSLIIISLFAVLTKCYSQEKYNFVSCENVKVYKINSEKYLTTCSVNSSSIEEYFGIPDSIIVNDLPDESQLFCYGKDYFEIPSTTQGQATLRFQTNQFKLIIQDSLDIIVGISIEKVLKTFPISKTLSEESNEDPAKLILYHIYNKNELTDLKNCTSRLIISYLKATKRIVKIEKIDIN